MEGQKRHLEGNTEVTSEILYYFVLFLVWKVWAVINWTKFLY